MTMSRTTRAVHVFAFTQLLMAAPAQAVTLLHANGDTQAVTDARKNSKGEWTAATGGRRVRIHPGDVIAIVAADGTETVIIPELSSAPIDSTADAALARLRQPKNKTWQADVELLAKGASRAVFEQLSTMAKDPHKEARLRAVTALAALRTKESSLEVASAVLQEKDARLRGELASLLHSIKEVLRRSTVADLIPAGLAHDNPEVRVTFAMIAAPEDAAALKVLRESGLSHRDHHFREAAALELGLRGDSAGEKLLIRMLSRSRVPGVEGDVAFREQALIKEQVQVCTALGKIATDDAKVALRAARSSPHEAVRIAANDALAESDND
ncbi:MAG: hypothetical protein KDC48_16235 [Planctomycetes bacterium]|nr:hypothetical protein [Planctomycetota bacterium]